MDRRNCLQMAWLLGLGGIAGCTVPAPPHGTSAASRWQQALAQLESQSGGRLGLYAQQWGSKPCLAYRSAERFPMCSTFKSLLVAQVLDLAGRGVLDLAQTVRYSRQALVPYSPLTQPHADGAGMTVQALCAAAVTVSDNTAANLLLQLQGGPAGLTQWLRAVGDDDTRLDRYEPDLNTALPGDVRDTTTPQAMAGSMLGLMQPGPDAWLKPKQQALLQQWLLASPTGNKRLRAGMPQDWKVGGKTGTGVNGTANDVVLVWPKQGAAPLVVAAYLTGAQAVDDAARDAILAQAGALVAQWWKHQQQA